MDYSQFIEHGAKLREVYPELMRLFTPAASLKKALDIILSPSQDDAKTRAAELEDYFLSQANKRSPLQVRKARDSYKKLAKENRAKKRWRYGGTLTPAGKDRLMEHIHKLRTCEDPASYQLIAEVTGIPHYSVRSWYLTWQNNHRKDEQEALKGQDYMADYAFNNATNEMQKTKEATGNRSHDEDDVEVENNENDESTLLFNSNSDEEKAQNVLLLGSNYEYLPSYEDNVAVFKASPAYQTLERRVNRCEALMAELRQVARAFGIELDFQSSRPSWTLQPSVLYPDTSDNALLYVKSEWEGYLEQMEREINEAADDIRPKKPDIDAFIDSFKGPATRAPCTTAKATHAGDRKRLRNAGKSDDRRVARKTGEDLIKISNFKKMRRELGSLSDSELWELKLLKDKYDTTKRTLTDAELPEYRVRAEAGAKKRNKSIRTDKHRRQRHEEYLEMLRLAFSINSKDLTQDMIGRITGGDVATVKAQKRKVKEVLELIVGSDAAEEASS